MTRLAAGVFLAALAVAGVPASAQESTAPSIPPSSTPALPSAAPSPAPMPAPILAPIPAPPPGAEDGRFNFHRVQDSFVRLDSRTGQVSVCALGAAGWACQAAPDERTALESEIGRLQGDNATLKKELLARGLELPGGVKADPQVARPADSGLKPKLPSDAELDRVLGFMEKIWRRLVEMMVELQRDIQRKS